MSEIGAWEFAEPEPVEASHLVRTSCERCGGSTLADPSQARQARCTGCRGAGAVGVLGAWGPVVGYPLGTRAEPGVMERKEGVAPELVGRWEDWAGKLAQGLPRAVDGLAALALMNGWRVRVSVARGARAKVVQDSVAIAFLRGDKQAVGLYRRTADTGAWAWGSVWLWGADLSHFGLAGVKDLQEWLSAEDGVLAQWYQAIRERKAGQELARGQKALRDRRVKALFAEWGDANRVGVEVGLSTEQVLKIVTKRSVGAKSKESGG